MRRLARAAVVAAAAALLPGAVLAHPLGNFTINHYDGLRVSTDAVLVDHVLDMAEIPTFQERQEMDTDGDAAVSDAEAGAYARSRCQALPSELDLEADGRRLPLDLAETGISFPQGQGAVTLRLVCVFNAPLRAPMAGGVARFAFQDSSYAGRRGWREIVVQGDGTTISGSDANPAGISDRLTRYPPELLATPSDQESASWEAAPGGARLAPFAVPDAAPTASRGVAVDPITAVPASATTAAVPGGVTDLGGDVMAIFSARDLTPPIVLVAILLAAGLGALHAISPGHGKTVMAAYLVGSRGSVRHALGLGLTVTISHTLGVLALGVVSLSFASLLPPDRLYPILGLASGLIVVSIGAWLLWGRLRDVRVGRAAAGTLATTSDHAHADGAEGRHEPPHFHGHDAHHVHADGHGHDADHAHAHGHDADHAQAGGHGYDADQVQVHAAGSGIGHDQGGSGATHDPLVLDGDDEASDAGGWHSHGGSRHTHLPPRGTTLSWRGLFALGLAGGMVPSVSALIVLLGSISLGRPAFGILLTISFGAGMAVVLVGIGMALVFARGWIERVPARFGDRRLSRLLPTATAFVVLVAGLLITSQALLTLR